MTNGSDVALEMTDIDRIESYLVMQDVSNWLPGDIRRTSTDNGHVESDIGLSQVVATEIGLFLQYGLDTVKTLEDTCDSFLVCLLARRETGLVNAIYNDDCYHTVRSSDKNRPRTVDLFIDPLVHAIDFLAERLGIEIDARLVFWEGRVEVRVEHADDLRRLVVHDRAALLVPEYGHGEAAGVAWVRAEVEVLQVRRLVERFYVRARIRVLRVERPAVRAHAGRHDGEGWERVKQVFFLIGPCACPRLRWGSGSATYVVD